MKSRSERIKPNKQQYNSTTQKPSVAVVIVTKNRPEKLRGCLLSVLHNTHPADKIIVVNEGKNDRAGLPNTTTERVIIVQASVSNLSKGRNLGIATAHSDIICFTDDDCIVDKRWIETAVKTLTAFPKCIGMFGQIKPYLRGPVKKAICPCVFTEHTKKLIIKPCAHDRSIGYGNNMAFRSWIFAGNNRFKEWLSIGSIGQSAEDAEFALRVLIQGHTLVYEPSMLVYHDKWLTQSQYIHSNHAYSCGEMACYGYFFFQGYPFASSVIKNAFAHHLHTLKQFCKDVVRFRWSKIDWMNLTDIPVLLWFQMKGLILGFIFSRLDPLRPK